MLKIRNLNFLRIKINDFLIAIDHGESENRVSEYRYSKIEIQLSEEIQLLKSLKVKDRSIKTRFLKPLVKNQFNLK